MQQAAEAALAGESKSAALVAVNASTGDILAVDSANPGGFDLALDGGFPPGSTFKVITSTALITHGLTPQSRGELPAAAPPSTARCSTTPRASAPVSTLLQAFAESCNTAFIQLATGHLTAADFPAAAAMFGVGPQPAPRPDLASPARSRSRPTRPTWPPRRSARAGC